MNSCITDIFNILADENIKTIKDLDSFGNIVWGLDHYQSNKSFNLWVRDIYTLIDQLLQEQKKVLSTQQKYIVTNTTSEEYLKYLCLFPSASLVITGKFEDSWPAKGNYNEYGIPKDFLMKLLENKDLVKNGVFTILPESIHHMDDQAGMGIYNVDTLSGNYVMGLQSPPVNVLGTNGVYITDENVEKLYSSFSWLYGASVEDYIDLIEKHKLLFDHYRHTITNYMDNIYTGNFKEFKRDLDEADISIRIALEQKKAELWAKGRKTVVSVGLATIPFIPGIPVDLKKELMSILGISAGASLLELYSLIETGNNIKNIGIDNPFWFAWKWKKMVDLH